MKELQCYILYQYDFVLKVIFFILMKSECLFFKLLQ